MLRWAISLAALAMCLSVGGAAHAQALPDTVRAAGITAAQWQSVQLEVARAANARGASERALAAVAGRLSISFIRNGRVDLDQVLNSIDDRAQQVADLQSQLRTMESADDPLIASLLNQAREAIDRGDLTRGDEYLAQAAESDLAGIARAQAQLTARRSRGAATIAERARLAFVSGAYQDAASLYQTAANTAPDTDVRARWRYSLRQAGALYERGRTFGEAAQLHAALQVYRETALPLAPRNARPAEWATTQDKIGIALLALGDLGEFDATGEAAAAYRSALEVRTPDSDLAGWAATSSHLALALRNLGERGDHEALDRAIALYRSVLASHVDAATHAEVAVNLAASLETKGVHGDNAALQESIALYQSTLTEIDRNASPDVWSAAENDLGNALLTSAERGNADAFPQAIAAFRAALDARPRDRLPMDWAQTNGNLANALQRQAYFVGSADILGEAIATYRLSLEVYGRETTPAQWAVVQVNLGSGLGALADAGDEAARVQSIAAYRAALQVFTAETNANNWALVQNNLGDGLTSHGASGHPEVFPEAIEAFNAALGVYTRERTPNEWALAQRGLAVTYLRIGQRGDAHALEMARDRLILATEVNTRERAPAQWADYQMTLGIVYKTLGESGQGEQHGAGHLRSAVAAYQHALEVFTRESDPAGWARSQINLANALVLLAQKSPTAQRVPILHDAVAAYRGSAEVFTREDSSSRWAIAQTGLGDALRLLGEQGDGASLTQAVSTLNGALEVINRAENPAAWAQAEFTLAKALWRDPHTRAQARSAARAAADVFATAGDEESAREARRLSRR